MGALEACAGTVTPSVAGQGVGGWFRRRALRGLMAGMLEGGSSKVPVCRECEKHHGQRMRIDNQM
jgi:hypothetical protein